MKFEWWMFVIGAVVSWGIYVPVLHQGQTLMSEVDTNTGRMIPGTGAVRAFLCVGIAYFITAVVVPVIVLALGWAGTEPFKFTTHSGDFKSGAVAFSTLGGIAGAAGALCIIFSLKFGGSPMFVPPLVFAGAPIVSAIVSVIWHWKPEYTRPELARGWGMFAAGILLAALGAGLVLYSKGALEGGARDLLKKEEARVKAEAEALAAMPAAPAIQPAPPEPNSAN